MNRRITIRDIARASGVSVTTVSRFLNGTGYVNDATRKRIDEAVALSGYEPNMVARGLKTGRSNFIVLAVPDIANPFYSRMARVVQALAEENGYATILMDSQESPEREQASVALAERVYAAGMILSTIDSCAHIAPMVRRHNLPTVGLCAYEPATAFDLVTVHESGGVNLAVEHLARLGHRAIAFVSGTRTSGIAKGRRAGFERQMAQEGLPLGPETIVETGFAQQDGYEIGRRFFDRGPLPTAICCANDLLALGIMQALNDRGVRIPLDVSVTGMDDIPYASLSQPRLSTVSNNGEQFASEGFRMLLERMRGECSSPPRRVQIENRLILRESTARPREGS